MTAVIGTPYAPPGGRRRSSPARPATSTTSPSPAPCWLALVRSPHAHARITLDRHVGAAAGHARRRGRLHRRRPRRASGPARCRAPGRSPTDMKSPAHFPLTTDKACYVGDAVAVVVAETRQRPPGRRSTPCVVDYEVAAGRGRPRGRALRPGRHPRRPRHQHRPTRGSSSPTRPRVDAAFADAAHTVKERYIQQRLIPSAMEPRGVLRRPRPLRRRLTALLRHPDPPHPQGDAGPHPRDLRDEAPGRRPGGGRRLRLASSTSTPRSCSAWRWPGG